MSYFEKRILLFVFCLLLHRIQTPNNNMKLREAADILNLPLEDITVESLKLSYRKLVLAWDPEKVMKTTFLPARTDDIVLKSVRI